MLKLCIFGFPMLFASLFSFFGGKEDPCQKNEARMNTIINTSIKQLSTRYNLVPIGRGGGNKNNKSQLESVSFKLKQKLTKQQARILIVEIVELFLHNINNNQEIASYLYDSPFTYKNLEFRVFIDDKDGSDLYHPDLGLVSLTEGGTVSFVTYAPGTRSDYASDVEEPYEETYHIAMQR
jgi:hypothetical protein